MENKNIESDVIAFISNFCGINASKISPISRIELDLGITGDDAIEFFDSFYENFRIDLTPLDLRKYFTGEGFLLDFSQLFKKKIKRSKHEVTVGDLIETVKRGVWVDPE